MESSRFLVVVQSSSYLGSYWLQFFLPSSFLDLNPKPSSSSFHRRSRKNRRKRERKKWTTKPGSQYEEVALIQMLHNAITSSQRLFGKCCSGLYIPYFICTLSVSSLPFLPCYTESVGDLVKELWSLGHSEEAVKLARLANGLLLTQRASLNVVWCSEITGAPVCSYFWTRVLIVHLVVVY